MLIIDVNYYCYYGDYKKVVFLYIILYGDFNFCMLECDDDLVCNVYFVDISNDNCYFSSCDIYVDVCGCVLCIFLSKVINLSIVDCLENFYLLLFIFIIFCVCVCIEVN